MHIEFIVFLLVLYRANLSPAVRKAVCECIDVMLNVDELGQELEIGLVVYVSTALCSNMYAHAIGAAKKSDAALCRSILNVASNLRVLLQTARLAGSVPGVVTYRTVSLVPDEYAITAPDRYELMASTYQGDFSFTSVLAHVTSFEAEQVVVTHVESRYQRMINRFNISLVEGMCWLAAMVFDASDDMMFGSTPSVGELQHAHHFDAFARVAAVSDNVYHVQPVGKVSSDAVFFGTLTDDCRVGADDSVPRALLPVYGGRLERVRMAYKVTSDMLRKPLPVDTFAMLSGYRERLVREASGIVSGALQAYDSFSMKSVIATSLAYTAALAAAPKEQGVMRQIPSIDYSTEVPMRVLVAGYYKQRGCVVVPVLTNSLGGPKKFVVELLDPGDLMLAMRVLPVGMVRLVLIAAGLATVNGVEVLPTDQYLVVENTVRGLIVDIELKEGAVDTVMWLVCEDSTAEATSQYLGLEHIAAMTMPVRSTL